MKTDNTPIPKYRFAPASKDENCIFGSERPGYGSKNVSRSAISQWIDFMDNQQIQSVCCLLDDEQMGYYTEVPLLQAFSEKFGAEKVLHAAVPDFQLCDEKVLVQTILPFLEDSKSRNQKTVLHCAGGKGRTGHLLAAWLVRSERKTPKEALEIVTSLFREPFEAVERGNASYESLIKLLLAAA